MTNASSGSEVVAAAVPPRDRIDAIDALRGLALFGVAAVNVLTEFRVSLYQQFIANVRADGLDGAAERFVTFFLEWKAISLFSILFGLGLAMQLERLSRGDRAYSLLVRRLLVLLAFGLVHLVFIWNGDILTEYALAGLLVLPMLRMPRWLLGAAAACALAVHIVLSVSPPLVSMPNSSALASHVAFASDVYPSGTFLEVWRLSVSELPLLLPLHLSLFPRTVALFLFGAFVWRCGVVQNLVAHRGLLQGVAVGGIALGFALTFAAASDSVAPVVVALGYGAVVLWIAGDERAQKVLAPFAAIGRMAFTNYVVQSVIFGFIFFGYGLGLFGRTGAASALLIVVAVYGLQILFSAFWLRRFRFGPIEWLWRSLMYNRKQAMRIDQVR
jgi:uncharacterized protein